MWPGYSVQQRKDQIGKVQTWHLTVVLNLLLIRSLGALVEQC
jgi:hypothetical protein